MWVNKLTGLLSAYVSKGLMTSNGKINFIKGNHCYIEFEKATFPKIEHWPYLYSIAIKHANQPRGCGLVVKHLPSRCRALGLIPITDKQRTKKSDL